MRLILSKTASWYNPYFIYTGNEHREVKRINIFNEDGVIHTLSWFETRSGSSASVLVGFSHLTVVRKNKEDFKRMFQEGKAFWIPIKKEHYQRHDKHNYATLYLPINEINVQEVSREETSYEHSHEVWDTVTYSVAGGQGYFQERCNYRKTGATIKNECIDALIKESPFANISYEIRNHFDELVELVRKIQQVKERK